MDAQVLNEVTQTKDPQTWISSNGIVFRFKRVSRMIITDAGKKIKDPKVPLVMNDDKGRMEENPNDPDYVEALTDANYRRGMLAVDVYLAMGTEVVSCPEDIEPVESDIWKEDIELFGIDVPAKGKARYVAWLKYYALPDDDTNALTLAAMRYGGATLEEDVTDAQAGFPDTSQG